MKKVLFLFLFVSHLSFSQSQKGFVQYGALAGVSFVNLYGNPFIETFLKSTTRVVAGPSVYYPLSNHWAVKSNLFYESKLQHETILILIDICEKLNYPFFTKFSLQTSLAGIETFIKKYRNTLVCNNIEMLSLENNILFVNLFSTAYYDFSKYGEVLFIETDIFKPALMFGNKIECSTFENLEYNISKKFLIN